MLSFKAENLRMVRSIGKRAILARLLEHSSSGSGRPVVVKRVEAQKAEMDLRPVKKHLQLLHGLKHYNFVKVIGALDDGSYNSQFLTSYLVEYMPQGSLRNILASIPETSVDQATLLSSLTQIAAGMAYLESTKMVHGQLSCHNCYVDADGAVKVGEFGVRWEHEGSAVRWMSWESALEGSFSTASDVWSFGVCGWEVYSLCAQLPYNDLDEEGVFENLKSLHLNGELKVVKLPMIRVKLHVRVQKPLSMPSHCPSEQFYRKVLSPCWRRNSENRPSFAELHLLLQKLSISNKAIEE